PQLVLDEGRDVRRETRHLGVVVAEQQIDGRRRPLRDGGADVGRRCGRHQNASRIALTRARASSLAMRSWALTFWARNVVVSTALVGSSVNSSRYCITGFAPRTLFVCMSLSSAETVRINA